MMNENMLVGHYIGMFKFICTYLEHVYELNEVKLISQTLHVYFTCYENLNKNGYVYE